eukprot:PhM_4_TR14453/c0_g1_i1/m.81111
MLRKRGPQKRQREAASPNHSTPPRSPMDPTSYATPQQQVLRRPGTSNDAAAAARSQSYYGMTSGNSEISTVPARSPPAHMVMQTPPRGPMGYPRAEVDMTPATPTPRHTQGPLFSNRTSMSRPQSDPEAEAKALAWAA